MTVEPTKQELEERILARKWFYRFRLPSGRVTDCHLLNGADQIHDTRELMIRQVLSRELGDVKDLSCIDIACHEGYFSLKAAELGFREVLGVDARAVNTDAANMLREVYGYPQLSFLTASLHDLRVEVQGSFDVVMLLGVLYHLENPVGALRVARAMCRGLCIIETQLAAEYHGTFPWGGKHNIKVPQGCFAVVDSAPDLASNESEANLTTIALAPSRNALLWILGQVGFTDIKVIEPPPDGYQQMVSGDRVLVSCRPAHSAS